MAEIIVGVRLKADGSGLVGQLRDLKAEIGQVKIAEAGAAEASRDLAQASDAAATAQKAEAASSREAAGAATEKAVADRGATTATRDAAAAAVALAASDRVAIDAAHDLAQASSSAIAAITGKEQAERGAAVAARDNASAVAGLTLTDRVAADAARQLATATGVAADAFVRKTDAGQRGAFQLGDLSTKTEVQIRREKEAAAASEALNAKIGLQRAGWNSLGYQMQDIGIQYSMNTKLSQIMAMQSGQVFSAINMIAQGSENASGKLGKFAAVMGGPWGIAATVAISLGSALWATFSKVDAAEAAASQSTIDFSSSLTAQQSIIAASTDGINQLEQATRGLINTQAILLDNLQKVSTASVSELERKLGVVDQQIADKSKVANSLLANAPGTFNIFGDGLAARAQITALQAERQKIAADLASARQSLTATQVGLEERAANERADPDARERGDIERTRARLRERRQFTLDSGSSGVPLADAPSLDYLSAADFDKQMAELTRRENALKDRPKKDNSAAKAAREAQRLAQFGERAEDAIARMNDQFNIAPRDIDIARQSTVKLDDIIADLEKRKPANFEKLIEQAQAVKPLIEESLVRPIRDMLVDQERQVELGRLQLAGRQADADALQLTYSLMDKLGVESEDQLATALAQRGVTEGQVRSLYSNLDVMRDQTRELRVQQQLQQVYLGGLGDMRENVRLTLQDLRDEGPKALADFAGRSLDVFDRLFSEVATEKLFGGLFRDLEDQLTGGDKVSKAGDKMAEAVDRASLQVKRTSGDIESLGKAAAQAVAQITGVPAPAGTGGVLEPVTGPDIVVTANPLKAFKSDFQKGFDGFFDDMKGDLSDVFTDVFGDKGIFSDSLGKTMGELTAGAGTGAAAGSLVTGILGIKGSQTGGAIGGAIGTAIAGPLGSVVGGTLGSVLGGLTKSTPKASATITGGSDDDVSVSGNKNSLKEAAVGLASSVQDTLAQIAEQFDGEVGRFAVSIGVRHGDYRVDTSGRGATKIKKGAVDFNDDEAGAIAYAVMDAIADGGITGISARIQKALASSDDLDEALEEALKVKEVEQLLGGLGAEIEAQFKAFERQAAERLRIATEYGFDVVAMEKKNAEDRAELFDSLLQQQVGSLQKLVEEMTSGSLFEGSAIEQRDAILDRIAEAQTDVAAGKDGAADTLAALFEQLLSVSEQAYGSTGQYAADRDMVLQQSQAAIDAATSRLNAAVDATSGGTANATSDPALTTTNRLLDEGNDQNARMLAALNAFPVDLANLLGSTTGSSLNLANLARTS